MERILPIEQRALDMTGHTSDLNAAFDQWELERQAMQELHDANQALSIHVRLIADCAADALRLVGETLETGAMFLPPKLQKRLRDYLVQYAKMDIRIREAKNIAGK